MKISSETKAIFFDHDDTLVGTIEACWALDKHVARTWYNKELTDDELRANWSKPLKEMVRVIFETDETDLAMQRIMDNYPDYPKQLLPGAKALLQNLKGSGFILGVISSTAAVTIKHDLASAGIDRDFFDYTQTQEDTVFHKPDPRVFEPAMKWLNQRDLSAQEVLYIGDGVHDGHAAVGAGLQFIGVHTGLASKQVFDTAGFASLASLVDIELT